MLITYIALALSLILAANSNVSAQAATPPQSEIAHLLVQADKLIDGAHYQQALELLTEAQQLAKTLRDSDIENDILNVMANAYYTTGQLDLAYRYYSQLVDIDSKNNDKKALSISLFNLGHVSASLKQYEKAQQQFQHALTLSQELKDITGTAYTLKAIGVNALAQSQWQTAQAFLLRALNKFQQLGEKQQAARVHRHLGDTALQQKNFVNAISHYQTALSSLSLETNSKALRKTYLGLSKANAAIANFEQALSHYQQYTTLLEHHLSQQGQELTQRLQVEYNTDRFVSENEQLTLINKDQRVELEHRETVLQMQYLAIILAAAIIVLVIILWKRSQRHAKAMQLLATVDELTGILNRRAILDAGHEEWQRAKRFNHSFCCCLVDIDHFKLINDHYGHAMGDQVLRTLAASLSHTLRETDFVGRFGGEEFLIIASQSNIQQTKVLADRIHQQLSKISYSTINEHVTVSIGIAELNDETSLDELISHADAALYEAKNSGRNITCLYQPEKS